ncbi:MAG: hypothetical protein KAI66_19100 [Lentisphaeria bacterium]|nr:hypothetical protein [Lentisphaeria bacterium]
MDAFLSKLESMLSASGRRVSSYTTSSAIAGDSALAILRVNGRKLLCVGASSENALLPAFQGEVVVGDGGVVKCCPLTHENAVALRASVPWTAPVSLRHRRTTIGCGDRLGVATPGHIRAVREYDAAPVLAQQSIRELTLTGRTYENVVDDVTFLVLQEGYTDGYGADGDHLKTLVDIDTAVDAGMAMITLDLTEKMNAAAEKWGEAQVCEAFEALGERVCSRIMDTYADQVFDVCGEVVTIDALEAKRCAVMYLRAMDFSREAYDLLKKRRGDAFDLEISIDETEAPTLPAHHLFIIRELLYRDIIVSSLAPRFIGEFQKAIDYIGDLAEFERQFRVHCAISHAHGEYKISIHSGSDKFSAYPIIGKHTNLRVHVKTAGTSWLEAVRAIAAADPDLYRRMHAMAFEVLPEALKLYHITPDLGRIPVLETVSDADLPGLMDQDDARQLVHVTYGGLLADEKISSAFFARLDADEEVYYDFLVKHFVHHLEELGLNPKSD